MTDWKNEIRAAIRSHGIRYVRFLWCDNAGLIRAKAVHTAFLEDYLEGAGVGIAAAQQAVPVMVDALASGSGLTPAGEVHMRADWSTFTLLPYAPGHARVLTDIHEGEAPWPHCPRSFLRRMIEWAGQHGWQIRAAFENEFYLLRREGDRVVPADSTVFAQTAALDVLAPMLEELSSALEAQGIVPEMIYAESGPGQFEMPIRYAEALRAADNQIIFRETVRAVARRHGLIASFVPKIFPDKAGNGAHLHFSLWQGDQNRTADPRRPEALSLEAQTFIAGILHHLPALMVFTTPSPNSYKRIRPRFWSGAFTCWGYGNREAAVRVPQPPAGRPITHVELKTVDPSCNPYLALGAMIAAGLDGLEQGLDPGEPVQVDPADLSEQERAIRGIRPLPASLGEAIAALEEDEALLQALGPELARSYLAVRRAEWEAMKDLPHEEEVQILLERY